MLKPYRAEFGPYSILLPAGATVEAHAHLPSIDALQRSYTRWTLGLGRFRIFLDLDARHQPESLKQVIDSQTRGDAVIEACEINGIPGVRHGSYSPRTWIDWWFKKGDTMVCLNLQSVAFPMTSPRGFERAEHEDIVSSLRYIPDHPQIEVDPA